MDGIEYAATIIATGEQIKVYSLKNGHYYDANAISNNNPPTAKRANKKEFTREELKISH